MAVTVIVPTYNRAHLLLQTIPTYLQDAVECLILVDDCSTDNTPEIAQFLIAMYPKRLMYIRNDRNRKQVYSKNRGKTLAASEFVYFGDDDSVLVPGSIRALLEAQLKTEADIVGAVALYCARGINVEDQYREYLAEESLDGVESFVDLRRLRFYFYRKPKRPLKVPVVHASMLVRREWYKKIDFDLRYTGNCYREETDYVLQATRAGARVSFTGDAVQINLPPSMAKGGARSSNRIQYEVNSVLNTWRFLRKHKRYFRSDLNTWEMVPLLAFMGDRFIAMLKKVSQ